MTWGTGDKIIGGGIVYSNNTTEKPPSTGSKCYIFSKIGTFMFI